MAFVTKAEISFVRNGEEKGPATIFGVRSNGAEPLTTADLDSTVEILERDQEVGKAFGAKPQDWAYRCPPDRVRPR